MTDSTTTKLIPAWYRGDDRPVYLAAPIWRHDNADGRPDWDECPNYTAELLVTPWGGDEGPSWHYECPTCDYSWDD